LIFDLQLRGTIVRLLACTLFLTCAVAAAQNTSTGSIRGVVEDPLGARLPQVHVTLSDDRHGTSRAAVSDSEGVFVFSLLLPGEYSIHASADSMLPVTHTAIRVEVGDALELTLRMRLAVAAEEVSVSDAVEMVQTQPSSVSSVISESDIDELPLNGRRFADLALLTAGVTQDPRSLTSASNGDLAFGGLRGWQTSYLVDGADNNNSFFAQARGRYRAPYQFSNEMVQEFRVSSNSYGVELGRAGGGVVNVVTRSGSNFHHGTAFYYVRDNRFAARHKFVDFKPDAQQHQFGGTIGGPIRKNRIFWYAGFDQHIFDVPAVVRFRNGYSAVVPTLADFEVSDFTLVKLAAESLSTMGGNFHARMAGNAALVKTDITLTPRHQFTLRANSSAYWGQNNVYFDPSSPVTFYAMSENGEEKVASETALVTLTSGLNNWLSSQLRAQFSRDLQRSFPNADWPRVRISDVIDGFGRSSILPRQTREHRLHLSETLQAEDRRHELKLGGDLLTTWIYNFFPSLYGGQYTFDDVRVNPWTFVPEVYGMKITPLRAYAHSVPRYYIQNFGIAASHPDTTEWAAFAQDTVRFGDHLAISGGIRWDYQSFRTDNLVSNYFFRDSGRVPVDGNNIAPRLGFAVSLGHRTPTVIRGGAGLFYTRIPSIYNSAIETDNGERRLHLFLDAADASDRKYFPHYPAPLVRCELYATECAPPAALRSRMESEVTAFAADFVTPSVQQASLSIERQLVTRTAVNVSYLFVRGQNLIRARDVNLPPPVTVTYPVFDQTGGTFTGEYMTVQSFSNWELNRTATCSEPPCLAPIQRPYAQLGSVTVFESAALSLYHGLTISVRRRMFKGLSWRLAYTWARAMDDGQDALVVGRPATVQNSYSPGSEWGASVTDQRHRFVAAWTAEPKPFHRDHPWLRMAFNDWRISGVVTFGAGRPLSARIVGDANRDGNDSNDRLPGYRRNAFTGPDYATADLRMTRTFPVGDHLRLELSAEGFNIANRKNERVDVSDDGFTGSAGQFVIDEKTVSSRRYPAHFRKSGSFLSPTNAYAPRQVQFSLRLRF
jgi:hypothetical protein